MFAQLNNLFVGLIAAVLVSAAGPRFADLSVEEQLVALANATPAERVTLLTELKNEIEVDSLTGARNRRALGRIERQAVGNKSQVAFIMFDLDHFKKVNDTLGHAAGDEVLKTVSEIIRNSTRDAFIRLGGEEFLVILEGGTAEAAQLVAERLRLKIEAAKYPNYPALKVTGSFGIAAGIAEHPMMWQALIDAADEALYDSKHSGRNQVKAAPPERACELIASGNR